MKKLYHGTCHCRVIAFEAEIDLTDGIRKCSCSFCYKLGFRKALIPFDALRILRGADTARDYQPKPSSWPPGDVNHYLCRVCGAPPFSRGYLEAGMGGNFWAVNVACLDDMTEDELGTARVIYEDGKRDHQERSPAVVSYCSGPGTGAIRVLADRANHPWPPCGILSSVASQIGTRGVHPMAGSVDERGMVRGNLCSLTLRFLVLATAARCDGGAHTDRHGFGSSGQRQRRLVDV